MKDLYSHRITNSFYLWFDHTLLSKAAAFQNITGGLLYYNQNDPCPTGYKPLASPFKQWVADSSISGAQIPDRVLINSGPYQRSDGLKIDWDNGRALIEEHIQPELNTFTADYSIKDFNTYVVSNEESSIVFEANYQINSRYNMIPKSGISPYGYAAPACFIMNTTSNNEAFAFGGMEDSKSKMRVVVVADSPYHLDGVISLFRDQKNIIFPLMGLEQDPINEYGDLKTGVYNYDQLCVDYGSRYVFIEKVTTTKVVNTSDQRINPNLRFGIIDFYLSDPRFPKLDL